jgi:N-acetylglutamate synthase-like GNAT family acetyltransferase
MNKTAMPAFEISTATTSDIPAIVRLINSAYRGESSKQGWTTEAELIEGDRMNADSMNDLINSPDALMRKCVSHQHSIVGCVSLAIRANDLYVSLLTVSPDIQAKGIGKLLLNDAEDMARNWGITQLSLDVISLRKELIDYYLRRGFKLTGKKFEFPADNKFGSRPLTSLELLELRKQL